MFIWYRVPTYSGVTTVFPASIWVSTQSTFISLSFRRWAVRHTPFTKFVLESSDKHVCLFQLCEIITTFFRRWGIVLFSGCTCKTGSEDVANWRLTLKAKCRDRTFRGRTLSYELYDRVSSEDADADWREVGTDEHLVDGELGTGVRWRGLGEVCPLRPGLLPWLGD